MKQTNGARSATRERVDRSTSQTVLSSVRVPSQNGGYDPACEDTLRQRSEPIYCCLIFFFHIAGRLFYRSLTAHGPCRPIIDFKTHFK